MTSAPSTTPRTADDDWWRSAVVYQVYVRSFADANADGVGDLQGIRQRLPYLRDLGVDALWLTPFYTSPQVDAGYDVSDYRDVDPLFGNLTDFDEMITDAHALGLRIIVDMVPNHTSSAHPWFTAALAAGPGSPERERYLFADGKGEQGELPPNDWESIFGGPAWTRVVDGQWYLHLFDPAQPDLNWRHPEVRAEFEDVLRFWLDRGVDGFRIDVAHGMIKAEGLPDVGFNSMTTGQRQSELLGKGRLPYFDQDEVHDIYRAWRPILDSYPGGRMAVAEAWAETPQRLARYIGPDELHQAFSFDFLDATWSADSFRKVIDTALAESTIVGAPTTWVLSNHDRQRHVTRYGDGEVGLRRARAAALLMFALPGCAYVYQGEELGLPEVLDLPDELRQDPAFRRTGESRDGCRVPIPWGGDLPPYGFGPDGSELSWLPAPATWRELSVAAQAGAPGSTLELYRTALRVRHEHPALAGLDGITWLETEPGVLAFRRTAGDAGVTCVVNISGADVTVSGHGRPLVASADLTERGDGYVLPVDAAAWFERR
ncbi:MULTISPECIES: glycoside hydrolase family 13 protein [unclassified Micromonospora]|uniref:glycoside hydrolase family 13 protein n=1 Tax=unclassified Micromonospora TaxID=2617518 RepID=UPI0018901560|nr:MULTISPECIES: glycoside hydrolase family 13 protein [unclassified Micromonospora]MBF5028386.1 glycoside hydrolase family 13 protein [Micromonospora sp. ANENR4]MCZ7473143.1 glycoside hydrolase family 13 protein [Micromonospora sp. WMMC273]WBC03816.1 glycoside hydrolase family 13 protein [Micromonospora sp. WMMA1976]